MFARFKMRNRDHVDRMDDMWLRKIATIEKQKATWTTSKMRKLDMNIAGEQVHWIRYGT